MCQEDYVVEVSAAKRLLQMLRMLDSTPGIYMQSCLGYKYEVEEVERLQASIVQPNSTKHLEVISTLSLQSSTTARLLARVVQRGNPYAVGRN